MFSKRGAFKTVFSTIKISIFAINLNPAWEFVTAYSAIFHTLYYTTLSYIYKILDNPRN